jgi:hypothetical protein
MTDQGMLISVESWPGMRGGNSVTTPACAGLAGASCRGVAARADRDLSFQDTYLVPGWGFAPATRTAGHFD